MKVLGEASFVADMIQERLRRLDRIYHHAAHNCEDLVDLVAPELITAANTANRAVCRVLRSILADLQNNRLKVNSPIQPRREEYPLLDSTPGEISTHDQVVSDLESAAQAGEQRHQRGQRDRGNNPKRSRGRKPKPDRQETPTQAAASEAAPTSPGVSDTGADGIPDNPPSHGDMGDATEFAWGATGYYSVNARTGIYRASCSFSFTGRAPHDSDSYRVACSIQPEGGKQSEIEWIIVDPNTAAQMTTRQWAERQAHAMHSDVVFSEFNALMRQKSSESQPAIEQAQVEPEPEILHRDEVFESLLPPDWTGDTSAALERWERRRVSGGLTDEELNQAIVNEYARWEINDLRGRKWIIDNEQRSPKFNFGVWYPMQPATYQDAELVSIVRRIMQIPFPIDAKPEPKRSTKRKPKAEAASTHE